MNSKFLYAATIAVSLVSTLAMADQAPVTRAQVNAETQQAIANGTLRRSDYDVGSYRPQATRSSVTREQVAVALAQDKLARQALIGPYSDRNYNPIGTQIFATSTLARSEVKNEVLQAQANGTLQRTDYDDAASLARKAQQRAAGNRFAQRFEKTSVQSGD